MPRCLGQEQVESRESRAARQPRHDSGYNKASIGEEWQQGHTVATSAMCRRKIIPEGAWPLHFSRPVHGSWIHCDGYGGALRENASA